MYSQRRFLGLTLPLLCLWVTLLGFTECTKKPTAFSSVDLQLKASVPFRFVAYGDTRFHDRSDTDAANPPVRQALVKAIAEVNPAFICFTGDIVYNGSGATRKFRFIRRSAIMICTVTKRSPWVIIFSASLT